MTPNESLDRYLMSLPKTERNAKLRDLRELCGKSYIVIYDWRKGRTRIDVAWQDKITQVIGEDIFVNTEYSEK